MTTASPHADVLELTGQLVLTGRLEPPQWQPGDQLALRLVGSDETLALAASPDAQGLALYAPLPGWVWKSVPPGSDMITLELIRNGQASGLRTQIPRRKVRIRLEEIARRDPDQMFPVGATLALEHVLWGGFAPELSANACAALRDLSARIGLTARTRPMLGDPPPRPGAPKASSPQTGSLDLVSWQALLDSRPSPEILRSALAETLTEQPTPEARCQTIVALTELLCSAGRAAAIYNYVQAQGLLPELLRAPDARTTAALFPHLRQVSDRRLLPDLLNTFRPADWSHVQRHSLVTGIEEVITAADSQCPAWLRAQVLEAWLRLVDWGAAQLWHPFHGHPFVGLMVRLIKARTQLPDPLATALERTAIRHYTLCPAFWRGLDKACPDWGRLFPALWPARRAGDLVWSGTPADIDRGLAIAEGLGVADTERHRLELLGPAGVPLRTDLPVPDQLAAAGRLTPSALMRFYAHPNQKAAVPPAVQAPLREMTSQGPRMAALPASLTAQERATRLMRDLLARGQQDPAARLTEPERSLLRETLGPLALPAVNYLGQGLCLSLLAALEQTKAPALRADLVPEAARLLARVPAAQHQALWQAAAPHSAAGMLSDRTGLPEISPPPQPHSGGARGLLNTVVTLITCRPNLDTRVARLRAGWIADLAAWGVPVLVMVGDGDGRQEGDVVHLEAPDDYEGLPQKVLAAAEWVRTRTGFGHMLKIDDDTFLNAAAFFGQQTYRRFAYYGRVVTRAPGQMTRDWHWEKARTTRGRHELDRSPEPARYADGGSGYVLSRRALNALARARVTPQGRIAEAQAFLEDKLIGDLLATQGIAPEGLGYSAQVLRRPGGGQTAVTLWRNAFAPSAVALTHQVHLDSDKGGQALAAGLTKPELWPRKIWPTWAAAQPDCDCGPLELLSPPDRPKTLTQNGAQTRLAVAMTRNDAGHLADWMTMMRDLGVQGFLIADALSEDGTLDLLAQSPDVALFSAAMIADHPRAEAISLLTLLANFCVGQETLVLRTTARGPWPDGAATGALPPLGAALARHDAKGALVQLRYQPWMRLTESPQFPKGPSALRVTNLAGPSSKEVAKGLVFHWKIGKILPAGAVA